MNVFILIILLAISIVGLTVCFCLYMALGKIKSLEKRNRDLADEKSKLSDQVRIKGIAVDRLTKELKRLEKEG